MTALDELETPAVTAVPGTFPVPAGRGRWRFTVHDRVYAPGPYPRDTIRAELTDARSRRLVQAWNKPATLTFTVDGHSPSAALVTELTADVMAWRWDDQSGVDMPMFRGVVAQTQDTLSEQTHTVNVTCHDYLAVMSRRFWTFPSPSGWAATDQDLIASYLVYWAGHMSNSTGLTAFNPGSYLPIQTQFLNPAGVSRALSGRIRDRVWPGQTNMGEALAQLAAVIDGFDYDCRPGGNTNYYDQIRIFYPYQGVLRTTPQLVYGPTVSALTRDFNSADYANYQRVIGNAGTAGTSTTQMFAEAWNSDANNVTVAPQGLWMAGDNASDVSIQSTLDDRAAGNLSRSGVVVPSYTLTLRSGTYSYGNPNMGDVVPLIVWSGRLQVDTTVRVVGIDYTAGDDGQEDVTLTVGRPDVTFRDLFTRANADVNALARR